MSINDDSTTNNASNDTTTIYSLPNDIPNSFPLESISSIQNSKSSNFPRHTNLDLKDLTFREQFRLYRLYYLTVPKCAYLATVFSCIAWFLFNVVNVILEYDQHNSIVVVEYKQPHLSKPPAVNFCTECLLCPYLSKTSNKTFYPKDFFENSMNDGVIIECAFKNDTVSEIQSNLERTKFRSNCAKYTKVLVSMQAGSKCFTYFSELHGQQNFENSKFENLEMNYDYQPRIVFRIEGKMINASDGSLMVAIHSPVSLPPMTNIRFHKVHTGKVINLQFARSEIQLRTPPAKPTCFNYRENGVDPDKMDNQILTINDRLSTIDSESIYRSKGECYMYCMWRKLTQDNMVNMFTDFSAEILNLANFTTFQEFKFANPTTQANKQYSDAKQQCLHHCPQHCQMEKFTEELFQPRKYEPNDQQKNHKVAYVTVQWAIKYVSSMTYKSNMDLTEFLGTIGGHSHIWLGVSFIWIIRYAVRMARSNQFLPARVRNSCFCGWVHRWFN